MGIGGWPVEGGGGEGLGRGERVEAVFGEEGCPSLYLLQSLAVLSTYSV